MINAIKIELSKALKNKLFFGAAAIGCIITLLNVFEFVGMAYKETAAVTGFEAELGLKYNTANYVSTPFGRWIGMEGFSLGSSILYFIFPLLIAIPYCWSYCSERKKGYEKNFVIRSGKQNYYFAKYVAKFISGGLTMVIPLAFNFLVLALFLPLNPANVSDNIYYGIFPTHLFSTLFYSAPYTYVLCMCIVSFIFCGLLACVSYSVSIFIKNQLVAVFFPFAMLVVFQYVQNLLADTFPAIFYNQFNPMYFLNGQTAATTLGNLLIEALILLAVTLGIVFIRGRKNEIY